MENSKSVGIVKGVNVSPTSNNGHFVHNAINVVNLDSITEAYFVEGESELKTDNHTTLKTEEDCFINCQFVYNPYTKMLERSKD